MGEIIKYSKTKTVGKLQLIPFSGSCLTNNDTALNFNLVLIENRITILIMAYHFDSGYQLFV
jgi:hypothetical protein